MKPHRIETASLVLTGFAALLFLPPLILLFATEARVFGIPLGVLYMFTAWAGLILATRWITGKLPDHLGKGEKGTDG